MLQSSPAFTFHPSPVEDGSSAVGVGEDHVPKVGKVQIPSWKGCGKSWGDLEEEGGKIGLGCAGTDETQGAGAGARGT